MSLQAVSFVINGHIYSIDGSTCSPETSLNTFLRSHANLRGTKSMCLEGGCGACAVVVRGFVPDEQRYKTWTVNSCLKPVFSCHGLEITTIEGLGNRKDGYHDLQKRLVAFNGTQCGYCSPGMVMNMYGLLEANEGQVTMEQVESSFGGNVCRCTGYRPILDAFKSLAIDAKPCQTPCLSGPYGDIEDLPYKCSKLANTDRTSCHKAWNLPSLVEFRNKRVWTNVFSLNELFAVFNSLGNQKYMLVGGNTAHGVYRRPNDIQVFIQINNLGGQRPYEIRDNHVLLSGNLTLARMIEILKQAAEKPDFTYCAELVQHLELIANNHVRSAGTIAGNLSIKHQNNEFPSDVYVILEAIGALLVVAESADKWKTVSVEDFLSINMNKKYLLSIILPALSDKRVTFKSYKIMPVAQNHYAYVNAGFLIELNGKNCVKSARICFGGINPSFTHARRTETLLVGKDLYTNDTLQMVFESLTQELVCNEDPEMAAPEYRQRLAIGLFYKFVLSTSPENRLAVNLRSGGHCMRPAKVSSGTQDFQTISKNWPVTKPVAKIEGIIQAAGELEYVNDLARQPDELWAAYVHATEVHSLLVSIEASKALALPGVHHFFQAKDIPGANDYYGFAFLGDRYPEEIFLTPGKPVLFHGQPVGIVLADTFELAYRAADQVSVSYVKNVAKPILPTVADVMRHMASERHHPCTNVITPKQLGTQPVAHSLSDSLNMLGQYHYTMEPQTALCLPAEDGIDVLASSQYIDFVQIALSKCLNLPNNSINVFFRRLGGAYGAKSSHSAQVACAAGIACRLTNRPIRFVLSMEANMNIIGKRLGIMSNFAVDVDSAGCIQRLVNTFIQDIGCSLNEPIPNVTNNFMPSCYSTNSWSSIGQMALTDAPSHTFCRGPASLEGIGMIENIMDVIADRAGLDPVAVRLANIDSEHKMQKLLPEFVVDIDLVKRRQAVNEFNANNKWRKRGISISIMEYPIEYIGPLPALVAVYHDDGSVSVVHGGIESGQGMNTKVAQVAAATLGVPYELIKVKRMDNITGANAFGTGGSQTSEAVAYAVKQACEQIKDRLKPFRTQTQQTWSELIKKAHTGNVDLTAKYWFVPSDLKSYTVCGLSCAEIEVDILTGNSELLRVDILEDTGESLNPILDVGQVEGAFMMGLGYWRTERIVHDPNTGALLSNRSWNYKPPGAKDIPTDFRVKFVRNSQNEFGFMRSKATGEPAICMGIVVMFALRQAVLTFNRENGDNKQVEFGAPTTPEDVLLSLNTIHDNFRL